MNPATRNLALGALVLISLSFHTPLTHAQGGLDTGFGTSIGGSSTTTSSGGSFFSGAGSGGGGGGSDSGIDQDLSNTGNFTNPTTPGTIGAGGNGSGSPFDDTNPPLDGADNPFSGGSTGSNNSNSDNIVDNDLNGNGIDDAVDNDFTSDDADFIGDPASDRTSLVGFFNTVVNDFNFLELLNLTNNRVQGQWRAVDVDGREFTRDFVLVPQRRADFDLHSIVGNDRFGHVVVSHDGPAGSIVGNISQYGNAQGSMTFATSQPLQRVFGGVCR